MLPWTWLIKAFQGIGIREKAKQIKCIIHKRTEATLCHINTDTEFVVLEGFCNNSIQFQNNEILCRTYEIIISLYRDC